MDTLTFSRAEKQLLALPVPCLAVGFLAAGDADDRYHERSELLGYTGPTQIVKARTTKNLRALLKMLGAID